MHYPQPPTAQVLDGALSMCVSLGEYHPRLNSEPSVFALGFPVVDIPGVSGCFGGGVHALVALSSSNGPQVRSRLCSAGSTPQRCLLTQCGWGDQFLR